MIPSLVAGEIRETLLDYLRTTWSLSDRRLESALLEFLGGETGVFKGPYLRCFLPFERASAEARIPLEIGVDYQPYLHQLQAWQRLSTEGGRTPEPTLVVTGTGSGKTEAFLLPILDHCLRARRAGQKGIKAVVLYPMNALASDQARRIGAMLWAPALRNQLRVGLYVGGEADRDEGHRSMGADHVIDVAKALHAEPPDLLLTNYRMLDFLLLRPKDRKLWKDNRPGTLRYLVLDELHSYDGAQGTDVACLVRRLRARLGGDETICPVGTSATVASSESDAGQDALLAFASAIFGRPFPPDSVVGETRRSPRAFFSLFGKAGPGDLPADTARLAPDGEDTIESYAARAARIWFPRGGLGDEGPVDRVRLGDRVVAHPAARALIEAASRGIRPVDEVAGTLASALPDWAARDPESQHRMFESLLALLSWSEHETRDGRRQPLLSIQVQLWIREVRHLVREVSPIAHGFIWREDEPEVPGSLLALPMYHCRECGHAGWITVLEDFGSILESSPVAIGEAAMSRSRHIRYLHTDDQAAGDDLLTGRQAVCPRCKRLVPGATCEGCGGTTMPVHVHRAVSSQVPPRDVQRCPACRIDWSLSMIASRAASVASVAVGHLYSTPFNSDRKLLAFSDSVQDASHRAGFFSGRTYRLSLRRAMLAVIPAGDGIALPHVAQRMWESWVARAGAADVVASFLPRDLQYLSDYDDYMNRVEAWREEGRRGAEPAVPPRLRLDLLQRLDWEVTREVGLASRIGRTLERTGCASVGISQLRFDAAIVAIRTRLCERLGAVAGVGEPAWRGFLAGLLQRLRLRGGIYNDLLRPYVESGGKGFFLSKTRAPLLSPFGRFTSRPYFWTDRESERFDRLVPEGRGNWYSDWAERCLGVPLRLSDAADLYRELLPHLVDAQLLVALRGTGRNFAWGLDPDALWVSRSVVPLGCATCGFELAGVVGDRMVAVGAPCLRFRCRGHLEERAVGAGRMQSYYRRFYERAELSRVWAAEHTGLLPRGEREELEEEFQARYRPDAPNMLSCTPTLEMGIDIGDLSATMLMSVPPTPASYLQRAGRAGRRTGNALILTVTSIRPHDRYFFEQPEAAMAGQVRPPGCYLDAPEILQRQALAFCFDRFTEAEAGPMPGQVRDLLFGEEETRFPRPLFRFIDARRAELWTGFRDLFGLSGPTEEALRVFMAGAGPGTSPMERRLVEAVGAAEDLREELKRLRERLRKQIADSKAAGPSGPEAQAELVELERESAFVARELIALQEQWALGYLCERGVLPNYAFPEAGVQLQAFVSPDRPVGPRRQAEQHKWTRAAMTAIRELAPANTFYGHALKVKIDNVKVGTRLGKRSGDAIRPWQLCSECGHMVEVRLLDDSELCPRCKADDWREAGRQRALVRMEQVAAYARERDATFSDETDERDKAYYVTERFYDSSAAAARDAWVDRNDQGFFGFELQPHLLLREINFGERAPGANLARIGGREVPEVEFIVCAECGQVHTDGRAARTAARHRPWCKARDKKPEDQPMRSIHLYREVRSEALRILLPLAMLDRDIKLPNLSAAMTLGLRRFFGGDPQHLMVDLHSEPTPTLEGARRHYLVVYDTVPGGTGVLAEVARDGGAKLRAVLEAARASLATCVCAARGARACYQCLYGHRRQEHMAVLDRGLALALIDELLGSFARLEKVSTISDLPVESVLESELERRFLAALESWVGRQPGGAWTWLGKEKVRLEVGARTWCLEPQVELDERHGVAVPCRPDFVLWPEDQPGVLPVAVFADGATYHVMPDHERARIADDFRKRSAILASRRFCVWSFAWDDLDWFAGHVDKQLLPWIEVEATRRKATTVASAIGAKVTDDELAGCVKKALEGSALDAFVAYLSAPVTSGDTRRSRWRLAAAAVAAAVLDAHKWQVTRDVAEATAKALCEQVTPILPVAPAGGEHRLAYLPVGAGQAAVLLLHADERTFARALDEPAAIAAILRLDDSAPRRRQTAFSSDWRQFLRAHNLLQFLPALEVATTEQLTGPAVSDEAVEPTGRARRPSGEPVSGERTLPADVVAELHEAAESLWPLLERAVAAGARTPLIPYEHGDENQWEIEVGWPERRLGIALASDHHRAAAKHLESEGWTVLFADGLSLDALLRGLGLEN